MLANEIDPHADEMVETIDSHIEKLEASRVLNEPLTSEEMTLMISQLRTLRWGVNRFRTHAIDLTKSNQEYYDAFINLRDKK